MERSTSVGRSPRVTSTCSRLAVADDLERDLVARVEPRDDPRQVGVVDRSCSPSTAMITSPPVGHLAALEADLARRRAWRPASSAGPPGTTSATSAAGVGVDAEPLGELRVERLGGDADVGVVDLAVVAQLVDRALGEVDRDREADPLVAAGGGLDLLVDPDHLARGVEQRAAGVAGVDRGVGLDRAVDLEARSATRSSGRSAETTPTESDWCSPNGLPIAATGSPTATSVVEPSSSGCRSRPSGSTLSRATSAKGSKPTISAGDLVAVGELDVDLLRLVQRPGRAAGGRGVGDHVGVGDDLAVVGDHEARALAAAAAAAEDRPGRCAEDREHRDHAGRAAS